MKTTVDIPDSLLERSRKVAHQEHITLRELVEEGLNIVLARHTRQKQVRIEPITFKGKGLAPELQQASWPSIRDVIYKGRGT